MIQTIGVCLGAWAISIVNIKKINGKIQVEQAQKIIHNGNPQKAFLEYFANIDLTKYKVVVTGRKLVKNMKLTHISEAEAIENAIDYITHETDKYTNSQNITDIKYSAIVSLGAETFILYNLDNDNKIANVVSKNKCASGTGEFFLQQIKRMDLSIDDAISIAADENITPYKVSGRCSVFCKSDCTHALNKGVPKADVTSGLAKMIADKIEELLGNGHKDKVLLVGGITKNKIVMEFLKQRRQDINFIIPDEADHFEALGAAIHAINNNVTLLDSPNSFISQSDSSFHFQKPISRFINKVSFKESKRRSALPNESCILGLDVGSTTTKAVIISTADNMILASEYLYTNGDPIDAAKKCYNSLSNQIVTNINIIGLGVTGSGRHIAGIHALTTGIYNEITAHSTAAIFFDSEVDTIFEIGGQDAKYTHIVNKIPTDYAMNEACSAGTGSFIEEAAFESLGLRLEEIEAMALSGDNPPNFSDQCAAFISSDIKTAQQEGISKENIVAALTYSIGLNYLNRVKGNRPVGKKILMQGGVCYNKAIPIAMAALADRKIIVPPDPGLMGAFGVALEVKEKQALGILDKGSFDLQTLANREVTYHNKFVCNGGNEKCDLRCNINIIEIEGKKYPFGGACDKYANWQYVSSTDTKKYDLVDKRNSLMFGKYSHDIYEQDLSNNAEYTAKLKTYAKSIAINSSFYTHNLFPLYYNFFKQLGFDVIVSDGYDVEGLNREMTSFCYPMQLSLCSFHNLLQKNPDYIFSPAVFEMDAEKDETQRLDFNCACAFVTGEPYALKQAYKDFNLKDKIFTPSLNFSNGYDKELTKFIDIAKKMGIADDKEIKSAYNFAVRMQNDFQNELYEIGTEFIKQLKNIPDSYAMVLLGRSYNSFVDFANKGIPRKFASRNIYIIPLDMIDIRDKKNLDRMYWEAGNRIMKVAEIVRDNPQLFATYITNFSCAPDSMILNSFRELMGDKPSLTLELDSHSADAGINTRIDAAIDIINNYQILNKHESVKNIHNFIPAHIEFTEPIATFISSNGEKIPLNDERVLVLIPAMGDLTNQFFASAFRSCGIAAHPLHEHNSEVMKFGRKNASGKECLPIILMGGSLLDYIENDWDGKKYLVYFQVQGAGNCRLGQYPVFMDQLIKNNRLENVAQMVLMNEDGFAGLGNDWSLRAAQALIASDVIDDIRSGIMANAINPEGGMRIFNEEFIKLNENFVQTPKNFYKHLDNFAAIIRKEVPSKVSVEKFKNIAMVGEIFCRRDAFAHRWLNKYFAERGFVLRTGYITEWINYIDYLISIDLLESDKSITKKFERMLRNFFMKNVEKKTKQSLEKSGYYKYERMNIEAMLKHSKHIIPLEYKGEPGLTLGIAMNSALEDYCGIINFGPFGCMPTRFAEAVSIPEMKVKNKLEIKRMYDAKYKLNGKFNDEMAIPFLTIESDGNPYSMLIEARLEAFVLQANRVSNCKQ